MHKSCGKRLDAQHRHRAYKDGRIHISCHLSLIRSTAHAAVVPISPASRKRRRDQSDLGQYLHRATVTARIDDV